MCNNEHEKMPKAVHYQCLWTVKDMDRLQKLENTKYYQRSEGELVFYQDEESFMTRSDVVKTAVWKLKCIQDALQAIPEEYRANTVESICTGEISTEMAHENTWKKWRRRFIRELAQNLNLI